MTRRGNNEGSIYKRTDGRWAATINLGWQDGKRKRKTFYGPTRSGVQVQLTEALRNNQQGLPVSSERQTIGSFLTSWLVDTVEPTVRPRTLESYEEIVNLHLVPSLGKTALTKLSPQNVQTLINSKLAAGLSPRRVQFIHAVLRRALVQAEKWGLVGRNVAKLVDAPRVTQSEIHPFDVDQAKLFIEAIKGDRAEGLYVMAIATGMRQAELLGLGWEDIDFEQRRLSVRRTLQWFKGEYHLVEPKTSKSRRALALPPIAVEALRIHRGRQIADKLQCGARWHDSDLVFTSGIGTPLNRHNVTREFKALLKRAGLPEQRFHDLRHTAATLLLAQDVPIRTVMEILGHSQISLTANTYAHVLDPAKRDAAERVNAALTA